MKKLFFFILITSLTLVTQAQNKNCKCCTENHKAFNFWIGDWQVIDSTGKKVGENLITVLENGCIINENWTGSKGSSGKSYNYYDSSDSTWNQLWIDNSGNNLKLKGKASANKMVLKSEMKKGKNYNYYDRISWFKISDNKVIQLWERVNESHQQIAVVFKGIYLRKEED